MTVRPLTAAERSRMTECLNWIQREVEPDEPEDWDKKRLQVARERWPDVAELIGFLDDATREPGPTVVASSPGARSAPFAETPGGVGDEGTAEGDASSSDSQKSCGPAREAFSTLDTLDVLRNCTGCMGNGETVPALYVARGASGLEWFECGEHDELDNLAEDRRVSLKPIDEWRRARGLPPLRTPAG